VIDPSKITNYAYTDHELEVFWLFCLVVAGKNARTQARLLDGFLSRLEGGGSPFDRIMWAIIQDRLEAHLRASKLGQYTRLSQAFRESVGLDLRGCTVEDLEAIHGVGPKTARLFVMHSRPDARHAAIDTHVLKLLKEHGYDVPKSTPTGKRYLELEQAFLEIADASGMSVADFDLQNWNRFSRG
jgi:hypothetical protein